MDVALAYEYRNDRPLFGLVNDYERELRRQTYNQVQEIRGQLNELFSVPENARDLQWSTNTMNLIVEHVSALRILQVGGITIRDMQLGAMRRVLDDGADDMIHGNNAIFPLIDILFFVIENIDLWLEKNPIDPVNHQLQNAGGKEGGEEMLEIPNDGPNKAANVQCTNSEKIVYFGIFIVVAFWAGYQIF
ncbi:hypothetical protein WR25_10603 [Diploscapter pachys]|uniref:Uncharacterized protein n=1 Tax=Diploscapter pachys TaxID=2018661 RepID=A0A2A2JFC5_9BILA|nr:hypothetical protein WR25_10603 [Diploscapter pachys]